LAVVNFDDADAKQNGAQHAYEFEFLSLGSTSSLNAIETWRFSDFETYSKRGWVVGAGLPVPRALAVSEWRDLDQKVLTFSLEDWSRFVDTLPEGLESAEVSFNQKWINNLAVTRETGSSLQFTQEQMTLTRIVEHTPISASIPESLFTSLFAFMKSPSESALLRKLPQTHNLVWDELARFFDAFHSKDSLP
jgi:hypothetical protein